MPLNPMTPEQIAWLAGLFEGEGHVRFQNRSLQFYLGMTDEDIVRRAADIAGIGTVRRKAWVGQGKYRPYKPLFHWRVSSRNDVLDLLSAIRPWLGARRGKQVEIATSGLSRLKLKRLLKWPVEVCTDAGQRTSSGAHRHYRQGEYPCAACAASYRAYLKVWRRSRLGRVI